jgi:hypothetical protein
VIVAAKIAVYEGQTHQRRRTFRWPGFARQMVRVYLSGAGVQAGTQDGYKALRSLITNLAAVSGNPRSACWRFVRQSGLNSKRSYRQWTRAEQQKLLDLIASYSLHEVAVLLRRSPTSVRAMLHRLGANTRMGEDWFTKHTLAKALHIRVEEIQKWIDRGWLKVRMVETEGLRREFIDAEDFCQFCKQHRREVVGRRLNSDRLNFVQTFVFPPSHMELLPVREAKKEQAAYEAQIRKDACSEMESEMEEELEATA